YGRFVAPAKLFGSGLQRLRAAQRHGRWSERRIIQFGFWSRARRERDERGNAIEHGPTMAAADLPGTHFNLLWRHTEDRIAAGAARVFLFSGYVHACGCQPAQPIRPPSPRDRF